MAHFELWERETLEQFAAEATRKLLENEAEIARLRTGHQRYETARRMNPRQWADAWSRPQVYWAAVAIGWYDLNSTAWDQIKTRWEKALASAKADPIPEYRAALPKPGQQSITREEACSRISEIRDRLGAGIPLPGTTPAGTKWAYALIEREASGEQIPEISRQAWREVLGYAPDADAKAVRDELRKQPAAA